LEDQPFNKGASCWTERNCFISIAKLRVGPLGLNIDWIEAKTSMHLVDTWQKRKKTEMQCNQMRYWIIKLSYLPRDWDRWVHCWERLKHSWVEPATED
jgi:hypothetical protein